jgi:hypothetical protein
VVWAIAYTPIHVYVEPHSGDLDFSHGAASTGSDECVVEDAHNGHDHSHRHPAEQHKFQVTQPTRAMVAERMAVQAMEWVDSYAGCPQPQVVGFSGLSPPELPCSWQFVVRAALPIRAPCLLA